MATARGNARELKAQALALLEWALEDMSRKNGPKLHIKCGFEREGHFIASHPECTKTAFMESKALDMTIQIRRSPELGGVLGKIYRDSGGTFILEAVTKPLGLLEATKAIDNISSTMLQKAPELGFTEYGFGSVPATCVDRLLAHHRGDHEAITESFINYQGEVFDLPDQGKTLVGRGTHCNLSVWLDNQELLRHTGRDSTDLVNLAAVKTMEWMPSMFLPCRKGNYHRIAAGSKGAAQQFLAADLGGTKAAFMLRYTADPVFRGYKEGSFRLEYRAGAAEADPYDVALAAAAPLIKTCEETMPRDSNNKIIIDNSGMVYTDGAYHPFPEKSFGTTPKSEAEAATAFNSPGNPYFTYLNELAERKIARMREAQTTNPSAANAEHVREAENLRNIGSKLFAAYCQEYSLKPCVSLANGTSIA